MLTMYIMFSQSHCCEGEGRVLGGRRVLRHHVLGNVCQGEFRCCPSSPARWPPGSARSCRGLPSSTVATPTGTTTPRLLSSPASTDQRSPTGDTSCTSDQQRRPRRTLYYHLNRVHSSSGFFVWTAALLNIVFSGSAVLVGQE